MALALNLQLSVQTEQQACLPSFKQPWGQHHNQSIIEGSLPSSAVLHAPASLVIASSRGHEVTSHRIGTVRRARPGQMCRVQSSLWLARLEADGQGRACWGCLLPTRCGKTTHNVVFFSELWVWAHAHVAILVRGVRKLISILIQSQCVTFLSLITRRCFWGLKMNKTGSRALYSLSLTLGVFCLLLSQAGWI